AGALEELTVHGDVAASGDLAVREHARAPHHQLGPLAEADGAVLEQAVDLDPRPLVELEARVAQDVALAEVAALLGLRGADLAGAEAAEQEGDLAVADPG